MPGQLATSTIPLARSFTSTNTNLYMFTPHQVTPCPIKRRPCIFSCFLWLSVVIIIFIFLSALCFFFLYIYIHPRFPEFQLDHFTLSEVKLTNDSGHELMNCQFDAAVKATNKNTVLWFNYSNFNISVWTYDAKEKDTLMGRGVVQGFKQGQKNATLVRPLISVQSEVVNASAAEDIVDRMRQGGLMVAVEVASRLIVMAGDWNVLKAPVDLFCRGIEAGAVKRGSNFSCQVNSFRM